MCWNGDVWYFIIKNHRKLTKIRPVVVWPDINSPAQSLASVIKVPSNSALPRCAFCSFCLGSFGPNSGSFRQQINAQTRKISTIVSPVRNVKMLDSMKHHHFRTFKHSSTPGGSDVKSISSSSEVDIPHYNDSYSSRGIFHLKWFSFIYMKHLT